jgi:hypothetical protein
VHNCVGAGIEAAAQPPQDCDVAGIVAALHIEFETVAPVELFRQVTVRV